MEKIKSILSPGHSKDDETMYGTGAGETSGIPDKLSGQGTHFGSNPTSDTVGNTPAYSSKPPGFGETTASDVAPSTSSSTGYGTSESTTNTGGQRSSPTTLRSKEDTDQTATGDTSSYGSGKQTGYDDTSSSGTAPGTSGSTGYNNPQSSTTGQDIGAAGVGSGAALTAASKAFDKHSSQDNMPGSFPDDSNPYANKNIDPRVDNVPRHQETTGTSSGTRDSALGAAGTGTAGAAAYKAMEPHSSSAQTSGTTAPSTMTSTADPAVRSSDSSNSANTRVPASSSGTAGTTGTPTYDSTSRTADEPHKVSMKDKVFGALGIGSAGAAAKERSASNTGVADDSYSGSGQPPSHHRKESIPTTAYPSGTFNSPRATAPPGGYAERSGLSDQSANQPYSSRSGHGDLGADAATGAIGGAGLGADLSSNRGASPSRSVKEIEAGARRDSLRMQAAGSFSGGYAAYDGRDHTQERKASQRPHDATIPSTMGEEYSGEQKNESHLGRDAAIGAGGLGAAGLAEHEYSTHHGAGTSGVGERAETGMSAAPVTKPTFHDMATSATPATSSGTGNPSTTGPSYGTEHSPTSGYGQTGTTGTSEPMKERDDRHLGRDAALGGAAGLGAGGLAAHEFSDRSGTSGGYGQTGQAGQTGTTGATGYGTSGNTGAMGTDGPMKEKDDSHLGRDAALGGAAGVGAGAVAGHESSKHDAEKAEKQREKEMHREQKAHDKELKHEEKMHNKELKHEEKAHNKELKHEEKERRKHEEAMEAEKKKRHEEEAGAGAGAAALGAGAYGAEKHHEHAQQNNELHGEALAEQRRRDYEERKAEVKADQERRVQERIAEEEQKRRHEHEGIAAGGVGAAALGAGAYGAEKHHEKEYDPYSTEKTAEPSYSKSEASPAIAADAYNNRSTTGTSGGGLGAVDPADRQGYSGGVAPADEQTSADHGHRGAETAGVVGVGGAAAAYEAEKHHGEHQGTSHQTGGLAAADSIDRETYGSSSGHNKLHKDPPQEKKVGIFRRIFKRRKNADTGESEDYSDEEDKRVQEQGFGNKAVGSGTIEGTRAGETASNPMTTDPQGQSGIHGHGHGHQHAMGESGTAAATDSSGYSLGTNTSADQGEFHKPSYSPFTRTSKVQSQVQDGTHVDRTAAEHGGVKPQDESGYY